MIFALTLKDNSLSPKSELKATCDGKSHTAYGGNPPKDVTFPYSTGDPMHLIFTSSIGIISTPLHLQFDLLADGYVQADVTGGLDWTVHQPGDEENLIHCVYDPEPTTSCTIPLLTDPHVHSIGIAIVGTTEVPEEVNL